MENTIYLQFKAACDKSPNSLAARFEGKTWTYEELDKAIAKEAGKLVKIGVKENDPIIVALPNSFLTLSLFYATSKIGAISYFVHPFTTLPQMETFIRKSKAHFLFILTNEGVRFKSLASPTLHLVGINPFVGINLFKHMAFAKISPKCKELILFHHVHASPILEAINKDIEDDAVYLNTGGTNGEPKIIVLTNGAINRLGMKGYPLIGGDVKKIKMLTAIPLFHGFGLVMGVHTPLSNGASTVLLLKFKTKEAIRLLKDGDATTIIGVPSLYNALLSRDSFYGPWLKKQIIAFIGGDSVPPSLLDRWNEIMIKYHSEARLYEGYGLTETVNVSNVNYAPFHKKGTVGKPLTGLKEIIIDVNTKKPLPPNSLGEILIAGDTLMKGYLGDEKLTEDSFIVIDGVRYVETKDYGSIDEDGYLTYRQRMRRIVKINGETLCPSDVEKVALSFYEIYEAYCFGIPDAKKGHVFFLIVVPRRGYESMSHDELKENLISRISERLTSAYMPKKIAFMDSLPRTPVGKIDDAKIKEMEDRGEFDKD